MVFKIETFFNDMCVCNLMDCSPYSIRILSDSSIQKTQISYQNINGTRVETVSQHDKYRRVQALKENVVVFEFKQTLSCALTPKLFMKDGLTWLYGSREYMSQLFVNLETGEFYDNCTANWLSDDGCVHNYINAHELNETNKDMIYESNVCEGFIWTDVQFHPSGNLAIVSGCFWACSGEVRLYDLSHLSSGWGFYRKIGNSWGSNIKFDGESIDVWTDGSDDDECSTDDGCDDECRNTEHKGVKTYQYINGQLVMKQ